MSKQDLLTPYNKNINLKNRVVMAPMTRGRVDNEGNVSLSKNLKQVSENPIFEIF